MHLYRSKIINLLGINKNIVALLVICILLGIGEKMAERFLPLYLTTLGGTALSISGLNALDNFLSAIYSLPGGWLSDKYGSRTAILIFNIIAIVGYSILIIFPYVWAVFLGATLFISWTALSLPAIMSLIYEIVPKNKQVMGVSLHSLVRRIPMAVGPILGGYLIAHFGRVNGIRLSFSIAIVMGILAVFLHNFLHTNSSIKNKITSNKNDLHKNADVSSDSNEIENNQKTLDTNQCNTTNKIITTFSIKNIFIKSRNLLLSFYSLVPKELRTLLVSDILVRFCEQIPYPFIVIWCVEMHKITSVEFGLLTAIEMITALLIYIPVAYFADNQRKKPFVVITFLIFTLFPIVLLFSNNFYLFVVAFIVRGLKEFGEPTRKALILELAPSNSKATSFGAYYLCRDIVVSIGALCGGFLWNISPKINLISAFIFGLLGTLWFALFGKDLKEKVPTIT